LEEILWINWNIGSSSITTWKIIIFIIIIIIIFIVKIITIFIIIIIFIIIRVIEIAIWRSSRTFWYCYIRNTLGIPFVCFWAFITFLAAIFSRKTNTILHYFNNLYLLVIFFFFNKKKIQIIKFIFNVDIYLIIITLHIEHMDLHMQHLNIWKLLMLKWRNNK